MTPTLDSSRAAAAALTWSHFDEQKAASQHEGPLECVCVCVCVCEREREREREST